MKKKRLVIYGDTMNLSGGRERVIANLISQWIEEYDITLLTKDSGLSYYPLPTGVKIVSLGISMKLNLYSRISRIITIAKNLLKSIFILRRVLNTIDYDYLYVSTPLNAFEAFYAMKAPEKKLVITEHASKKAFNSLYTWMKYHVYHRSYCISVPNKMDTIEYQKEGCNAVYIPHTLTFSAVTQNTLKTKIMLNVGRLTSDKQQNVLLNTWANLENRNGWELWIIGEGEEQQNLEQIINNRNLGNSVKLLPARKNIKEIYQQASCFVLTSKCEGFGMVLLEAMAFGIPCISFDCPSGPRDIIQDGVNGFLIPDKDESLLQKAIRDILFMKEESLVEMGNKAYETVLFWDNKNILSQWRNEVFCKMSNN